MKRKRGDIKFKLGLFVTIGTVLFILAIYLLGRQKNLFGTNFELNTIVTNVSGLQVGNNVRYSGIKVGTVENIQIMNDTLVRIEMIIDNNVKQFIKKDSKAVIGSEGLMGNKLVDILPGSVNGPQVKSGDLILSAKPIDLNEIMGSLQRTGENIEHITHDFSLIMHNVSHGKGTIGKVLVDSAFAETLHQSLINIEQGTQGFSQNMEALKGNVLFRRHYKKQEEKKQEEQEKRDKEKRKNQKSDKD